MESWQNRGISTFVIAASDRYIDVADYKRFVTADGQKKAAGKLYSETILDKFLADSELLLLIDDYVPTDILVAPLHGKRDLQQAGS